MVSAGNIAEPLRATRLFNAGALLLLAIPTVMFLIKAPTLLREAAAVTLDKLPIAASKPQAMPDVFVIVLDGYGRTDALLDTFGFDNTPFQNELKAIGFEVGERNRANYAQTEQVFASMLNAAYIADVARNVRRDSNSRIALQRLASDSRIASLAKSQGYEFVPISSGFYGFDIPSNRLSWSHPPGLNHIESLLLHRTPERDWNFLGASQHQAHRDRIEAVFDRTASLSQRGPKFVVAHVMAPHPPFVFDEEGRPVNPARPFGLWDCQFFVRYIGSRAEYVTQYPRQLRYVNRRVLETVRSIMAKKDRPSIIVLLGDHGSRADLDANSLQQTDTTEAFRNFCAVYSSSASVKIDPNSSPINVMRSVARAALGADLPPLEDRSYYSTWNRPFQYTDVTEGVE